VRAVDIAARVASGEVTATSVAEAALAAVDAAAELNLFTLVDHDGATTAARRVDETVASGAHPGPLAGVPVVIKDLIDQRGLPTTCGSSFYREIPERSATVVDRLQAAGAVIIGRAGLHEFALGFSSENQWFGPVRNPWDPSTSPGGSSGGSAAAVAAGVVPIGIGTDTGGSVRVPAALTGCTGLKVTHGRVPLTGVFPVAPSLDTVGPITADVADAAAVYAVIAGSDGLDPWAEPAAVEAPAGAANLAALTIGVPHPWVDRPLERLVADGFARALDRLADGGARIVHLDIPAFDPELMPVAVLAEAAAVHRRWLEEDPTRYGDEVRRRIEMAMEPGADEVAAASEWRQGVIDAASAAFDAVDVLLTPATAARRKVIGEPTVDAGDGPEPYGRALSWFCSLVNQMGCPALAAPLVFDGDPPPSLQVIAPWRAEARLLEVGLGLEAAGLIGPAAR
jgi:aspartyl-tRNA(Asn)/glutamyl-tRNA(Gln) amidotransferase subunit A